MTSAPVLSAEVLGWARTAGYVSTIDAKTATIELRPEVGAPIRYFIGWRRDRLALVQDVEGDDHLRTTLFAAEVATIERHLIGVFGDDIREELGLPFLELPWDECALAAGYELAETNRGFRTLIRTGHGPVAAAPEKNLSLLTLVPLSHFLGLSTAALKDAFLHESGAPLLSVDGHYASCTR